MEDFIMEIEKNTARKMRTVTELKNRELLQLMLKGGSDIKISNDISKSGDITFSTLRSDIGLESIDTFLAYKKQIFSPYIATSIGELLVRENIGEFVTFLTDIDADSYHGVVNGYRHDHFGIEASGDSLSFSFHISLIQSILTEDLKGE